MRILVSLLLILVFALLSHLGFAQEYAQEDRQVYQAKIQVASTLGLATKPINKVIEVIGKSFIGAPYEGGALEKNAEEQLIIHLTSFDCTTFVENVIALAQAIKSKQSFENYAALLKNIRYRNGIIRQYPSRMHYFSDWVYDNTQKKIIKNISQDLGGEVIQFHVNFMSHSPELYPALKMHTKFVPIVARQEQLISKRKYFYIPKNKLAAVAAQIKSGDLLAITTNIAGLDITHVGIAVHAADGKLHLLHASSQYKQVMISELPLQQYLDRMKKNTGVMALRVLENQMP